MPCWGLRSVPGAGRKGTSLSAGWYEKRRGPVGSPRLFYRGRCYSRTVGLDQAGVDRLGDLGGVGGTLDGGTEVLVHERLGDLGQDLEVRSAGLGTGDE